MPGQQEDVQSSISFVKLVEQNLCLWNYKLKIYCRTDLTGVVWKEIAEKLKETEQVCRDRWKNIRTAYGRSLKPPKSGSGFKSKKPYYLATHLDFLRPYMKGASTSGSLPPEEETGTQSDEGTLDIPETQVEKGLLDTRRELFVDEMSRVENEPDITQESRARKKKKIPQPSDADKAFIEWLEKSRLEESSTETTSDFIPEIIDRVAKSHNVIIANLPRSGDDGERASAIVEHIYRTSISNKLIPDQQHGFLPGRSTLTNLLVAVNDWTKSIDADIPIDVIYLDFAKAFDKVPHRHLIHKLEHLGIRGKLLSWIDSFLNDRKFRVRVGGVFSDLAMKVTSGVPQGSVLGPILFLLYTSDLPSLFDSSCLLFADDAKLYRAPSLSPNQLQLDLDKQVQWAEEWQLPLNVAKCCVLHIGRNNPRIQYTLDRQFLTEVRSHRDLGVLVNSDLDWSEHIAEACGRAKRTTYLLQKTFGGCSIQVARLLYTSYVRPLMEYAGPVWWVKLKSDSELLESVQRWCTRIPFSFHARPDYLTRLRLFELSTFEDRRTRGDMLVTFRAVHNIFGVDLRHLFALNNNSLRGHNYKLAKEPFRTTCRMNLLSNRVFNVWNHVPEEVVGATSVNGFKNGYDRWKERFSCAG
ncbi:uncharacterized protein LOC123314063 [Coccinella septempunctata]|uniref:uncharacterized protein LOC123314063 n=1 Tax=Coccinella septempunctata TaxID=41139 RepID=UPI001D05E80F|nr:uncharacterized protein LOC123314063 [Coccinella septempunctata]